jgi:hypothetical protein
MDKFFTVFGTKSIQVDVSLSHDSNLNRDLSAVARSATQEFSTLFSVPPPAGIRPIAILYCAKGPRTDSTTDTTRYKVYLSVNTRHYARLVYQLGHELCHIFTDPRRTNWFVESCCAMASTVLLCRMSKLWSNNPPYPNWRSYAPKFQQYAQNVIRDAKEAEQPTHRQGQVLNAEILCPLFEESSDSWNAFTYLGKASTSPPDDEDLTDWNKHALGFTFDRWLHAVPPHFKGIVLKISSTPEDHWDYRVDC